jgi:hypothetical protein
MIANRAQIWAKRGVARQSSGSVLLACLALAVGCEDTRRPPPEPQASEPSPNASILPAPLASEVEPASKLLRDAGVSPDAGTESAALTPRRLRDNESPEQDLSAREGSGIKIWARLRWLDLPPFPRLPEMNADATQKLRESLSFDASVELSANGRMKLALDSDAFTLPRHSEFRSRLDRLGHVLTWNSGATFTVLPVGTLRAVLNEHRIDAAPLAKPKLSSQGPATVLSISSERSELNTPLGRMLLDQATFPNAGPSGRLLCRLLSELIAADPSNAACERALVPLRAELFTRAGGHLLYETLRIERDHPVDAQTLQSPPAGGSFVALELPAISALVPNADRLRDLRNRALPRAERPDTQAPKNGLLLVNRGDSLRYVLLDGVVLARLAARSELKVETLLPGKYALSTLDFLGDEPTQLRIIELPARVALGDDAESPR